MEKFNRELNGYKRSEVNDFLNEVIDHTEKVLSKIEKQRQEIKLLNEKLVHYQSIESSMNIALNNAETVGNNIRRMAQGEARQIIDDARRNADRIINDSLLRTERLEIKNANVERNLRIFKKKLRAIVEQQLEIVDEIEILEVD